MGIEEEKRLILRNAIEVVTEEEVEALLREKPRGKRKAYIGFEPSGIIHIGWLICVNKIKDLVNAGFEVTILLADWHAYINNKFNGDIDKIRSCARYMIDAFSAMGVSKDSVRFRYAYELMDNIDYWERVLRIGKAVSLARVKRALTIMGRREDEAESEAAMIIYPLMQAADIFALDVDIAYGGIDQRKVHMLARDVAEKEGWRKPIALHTPLLSGLDTKGRMDPLEAKMSKSRPDSGIFIHDSPEDIKRKIKKAYCPQGEVEGNPIMEMAQYIVFPMQGELHISRPEKWGGDLHFTSYSELEDIYTRGELHPMDLKNAVAQALIEILSPVREYFEEHPEALSFLEDAKITR